MPALKSPLLRDWDLLQAEVIPPLVDLERGQREPRLWSVGSVADAVAVAVAYQHARRVGSPGRLRAFASERAADLSAVSFSLADIRCLPAGSRSSGFHRQDLRWVPDRNIAEQVVLSDPTRPVDLITLRASDGLDDAMVDQLSEGGHVLLIEPGGVGIDHHSLRPVGHSQRLYRKCSRGATRPGTFAPRTAEVPETLAGHRAQSDLVSDHIRLARSLARRFSHHGESKEDLEQVALLALVKAARRFDSGRDTSFSTYATASILGEIKRHFRDKTWMMRVPRSVQETYLAVKEARESLTHELSASPTVMQIAERIGVSDEVVLDAMEAGENYWPESLDVGIFDGDPGRDVPVTDGAFDLTLERQQLMEMLPRLTDRERLILKRLYFDSWTQRQAAAEIGVSQMQVSRVLARTIEKLRSWLEESDS